MRFSTTSDEVVRIKGRQGRSAEVRRRKTLEREYWVDVRARDGSIYQERRSPVANIMECIQCKATDKFVEDHASGDMICSNCGVIQSTGGLYFSQHTIFTHPMSKPYQKVVHFRQRISQLLCRDPEQDPEHIERIGDYIRQNELTLGTTETYGIKTFSMICRQVGLNPKIASHWMQIRKRLGFGLGLVPQIDPGVLLRITMRYICISHCFEARLKRRKGDPIVPSLKRNNVINLNYSIIQLIRIESEEHYIRLAKFFPQLISQNQPDLNNKRWKILLEDCRLKYQHFSDPLKGDHYQFDWPYKPITVDDLVKHFYFFH